MTTITLKNIPDDLYGRLKSAALLHRNRSNGPVLPGFSING